MKKIGLGGILKPGSHRRSGGKKVCFGPGCGAGKKAGGKKKAR